LVQIVWKVVGTIIVGTEAIPTAPIGYLDGLVTGRAPCRKVRRKYKETSRKATAPNTLVTHLLVNIDHVATLRNARKETFPDPVEAARLCESSGASGIVFHLRQDRRHIRDEDVAALAGSVTGKLDFELSLAPEIVDICCRTRPHLATIVPETREEITTEGGLDVAENRSRLREVIPRLFDAGVSEVALFLDPVARHIEGAASVGATCIELHTGQYATAATASRRKEVLEALAGAAELARKLGLRVHAGHGLDTLNYPDFGRTVPYVEEVSIGFAIIARSIAVGLPTAVREMIDTINSATNG
jgi:pyridoxine 5-phosphate synthase